MKIKKPRNVVVVDVCSPVHRPVRFSNHLAQTSLRSSLFLSFSKRVDCEQSNIVSFFANVKSLATRRNGQNSATKRHKTFANVAKDREATVEGSAKLKLPSSWKGNGVTNLTHEFCPSVVLSYMQLFFIFVRN